MRKSVILIVLLIQMVAHSQAPQSINYQAVARTSSGAIIPMQLMNIRFSILDGNVNGAAVYQEVQKATTNSYGLFTLAIGKGTQLMGTFQGIDWGSGSDKFLKVEIAPDGTANYQIQGTTQLMSVPYALYSEKTKLVAGNAISISNGNTISAYYQAGTGININGAVISHALQPGSGIAINGATISSNLVAGTGIAINGATISSNLVAGTGIAINGNVISSLGSNQWINDTYGMHNTSGNIGINSNSNAVYPLNVKQPNTNNGYSIARFESDDNWHAAIALKSNSVNHQYAFIVGGATNTELKPDNFGIMNTPLIKWVMVVNGSNNNVGFGSPYVVTPIPKSTVHVFTGDVNIEQIGSGIIMKSPNGQCWRITIDNSGNLVSTSIPCP